MSTLTERLLNETKLSRERADELERMLEELAMACGFAVTSFRITEWREVERYPEIDVTFTQLPRRE